MKNLFLLTIAIFSVVIANAQGDICSQATPINLDVPLCGSSSVQTFNFTTNGATAENPYSALACMDAPAADVWFSFIATGNELDLNINSGMNDMNVGLYYGSNGSTCGDLLGFNCGTSNNGNFSELYTGLVTGDLYYLQISGANETDTDDFTLELESMLNCDVCLLQAGITASPGPTNGVYQPGTSITFCLEISEFDQISSNWLSGVVPTLSGNGWASTTATPVSENGGSGTYDWFWYNSSGNSANNPTVNQPGWYVDIDPQGNTPPDGNAGNNYGDPGIDGTGNWQFCWQAQTLPVGSCVNGASLTMDVNTYVDGEIGSYTVDGCENDPSYQFTAIISCCDFPLTSFVDPPCGDPNGGSATATGQGGTAPYDYVWENSSGQTVLSQNDLGDGVASSATGLAAGTYTVTVTDDNGCEKIVDITLTATPSSLAVDAGPTVSTCPNLSGGIIPVTIGGSPTASGSSGYTYTWTPNTNLSNDGIANPTAAPTSTTLYTVSVSDAAGCTITDTVTVVVNPLVVPTFAAVAPVCQNSAEPVLPTTSTNGISGAWSPAVSTATAGTQTYTFTPSAGQCADITTLDITVTPLVEPTFSAVPPVCQNATAPVLPTTSTNGITGTWNPVVSTAAAGTQTYTFTSSAGQCADITTLDITINPLPIPVALADSVNCFAETDGAVTVTGVTGTSAFPSGYSYSWDDDATLPALANTQTAAGLGVGVYTVTVQDLTTTCIGQTTVEIFEPTVLSINPETHNDPICNGDTTG
ncbi:hypothetical protein FRY74_12745, partial [Vicingus serpentipes]